MRDCEFETSKHHCDWRGTARVLPAEAAIAARGLRSLTPAEREVRQAPPLSPHADSFTAATGAVILCVYCVSSVCDPLYPQSL